MADTEDKIERFRQTTAATVRAIAHKDDLTLEFSAEETGLRGTEAVISLPSRDLPVEERANLRGESDAIALRVRHHNAVVHARRRPGGPIARAIYESLEQTRCEALGARQMTGVAANLAASLQERCQRAGFARIREKDDAPLAEVLGLLAREALTGQAPPPAARAMVDLWRNDIEGRAGQDLNALVEHIHDQERYASAARKLIRDLELGEDESDSSESEIDAQDAENSESDSEADSADSESAGSTDDQSGDTRDAQAEEGVEGESGAEEDVDAELVPGGGDEEPARPGRPYR
ncbi:MAG: cobaltochelatase subunit CobT, partial [Alphaproteobacteria bacterium]